MSDKSLIKLVILSFKDREFKIEDLLKYIIPVNPESIRKSCRIELENRKAHGTVANDPKFRSKGNEQIQFEFTLDGTKTVSGYHEEFKNKSVKDQLDEFLKCAYNIDRNTHRPRFLILFWGKDFNFQCQLSNIDINYTLFDPDGSPLRAKINVTFIKYVTPKASEAEEPTASPDLSHYRIIKADDRLDNLSYEFYNNPKYLIQLARINGLTSFRNLEPGNTMIFPPFAKNENQ